MEKTMRYAEIPMLKGGVVFSDPFYGPEVWCQYRKKFHPSSSWVMRMESSCDDDGFAEFALFLGRRSTMSGLRVSEDGEHMAICHYKHHNLETKEIGADTACVYIGSMYGFEQWGEVAAIKTGADGLFGELYVVTCEGEDEPAGFLFMGAIDTVVTDEDKLFRTVVSAFDGREINRERFEVLTNRNDPEVRKALAKETHHAKSPLNLR